MFEKMPVLKTIDVINRYKNCFGEEVEVSIYVKIGTVESSQCGWNYKCYYFPQKDHT